MEFSKCRGMYKVPDINEFRDRIEEEGWSFLGVGAFSHAYRRGRYVWKINTNTSIRYNGKNDGAFHFLVAVLKGKIRSWHAPRVFRILFDAKGRFAVLMERLGKRIGEFDWSHPLYKSVSALRNATDQNRLDGLTGVPASLVRFAKRVMALFPDFKPDMHTNNVLLRGDVLVVADPLSFRKDLA